MSKDQIKITYTTELCEINDKLETKIIEAFDEESVFKKKLVFSGMNYQTSTRELIFE